MGNFLTRIKDIYLEHFLHNCPHVNATRQRWRLVNSLAPEKFEWNFGWGGVGGWGGGGSLCRLHGTTGCCHSDTVPQATTKVVTPTALPHSVQYIGVTLITVRQYIYGMNILALATIWLRISIHAATVLLLCLWGACSIHVHRSIEKNVGRM